MDFRVSGPIFDGRAEREMARLEDDVKETVARQGLADLHFNLDRNLKHQTPYYTTQLLAERQVNDWVVHDRGVIYGPWLEGVGSRNYPVTAFQGYHTFRATAQELRAKTPALIEPVVRRHLRGMQ